MSGSYSMWAHSSHRMSEFVVLLLVGVGLEACFDPKNTAGYSNRLAKKKKKKLKK